MGPLSRSKTLKFGLPMLLLIVGGSFGLREFTQVRYDVQKVKRKIDPALEAQLSKNKDKITVESEYQFADDTKLGGSAGCEEDANRLQSDLDRLETTRT
uniref:cytochrome c oxidase assembly protein COX16 homolog, mitochondrial isoform X2 n=1 Tax=Pristiophorus japonicus TaxID=55135 RepID=UPI00398E4579